MLIRSGKAARLVARVRRAELDRRLATGADPSASSVLAARAAQLTGEPARRRIAAGLERLALADPGKRPRLRVMPSRRAVAANRPALLDLASMLRRPEPLYAQGVATLELVLIEGAGPAYTDRHGEALARELELAALRLRDGAIATGAPTAGASPARCGR